MISINTNSAASAAAYNLGNINTSLQKSLQRLSSGSRINSSFDDAGGLAVSMKLSASIRRTEATQANVNNSMAFLETQDGVLKSADKLVARMSELAQLANDVTKSTSDLALYQTEVNTLKSQLTSMMSESFNGISLFSSGLVSTPATATTLSVVASQDGSQTIGITRTWVRWEPWWELHQESGLISAPQLGLKMQSVQ
jgi:flagellin